MNEDKWVVLQLSSEGESLDNIDELVLAIQKIDPSIEIYVPSFSWEERGITEKVVFLPGYIFVRFDISIEVLEKVLECKFILQILKEGNQYSLVGQQDFEALRERFKQNKICQFIPGKGVRVIRGFWRGYDGEVVSVSSKELFVVILVKLSSTERLLDVPIYFVEEI